MKIDSTTDRSMRELRILTMAEHVFKNKDKALRWLHNGRSRWGGRTPWEMLQTDMGTALVEEALIQIDEGFFT